jgi:hypothetical protein
VSARKYRTDTEASVKEDERRFHLPIANHYTDKSLGREDDGSQ